MTKAEIFLEDKIEDKLTFNSFDHKRQYPITEIQQWLEDFAINELLDYVYNESRVKALAEIYKDGPHSAVIVAKICDEVIDRTGKLLGEVRKIVRDEKEEG